LDRDKIGIELNNINKN